MKKLVNNSLVFRFAIINIYCDIFFIKDNPLLQNHNLNNTSWINGISILENTNLILNMNRAIDTDGTKVYIIPYISSTAQTGWSTHAYYNRNTSN